MIMRRTITLFLAVCYGLLTNLNAQTVEEQMTRSRPSCNDVFINAMEVLPKYYREKNFDSLNVAIHIWENSCGQVPQIKITYILFAIQQRTFKIGQLDSSSIILLNEYAERFQLYHQQGAVYTSPQTLFYRFSSAWAGLMLENKHLDENEKFVCSVLKGEIKNPEKEIRANSALYPELMTLVSKNDKDERDGFRANYTIISGAWIPTGNLSLLGVKPSIGFQIGARNKRHQIDLTFQIRFLKSDSPYTVKRNGELIVRDAYFGGYVGLDYNYYFISNQKTDLGIVVGMGYDGFDISGSDYYNNYYNDYLRPTGIGSFNANGGLRFNYYVSPSFYLGLQGRYNWINYGNPGGTNLNGDGYSSDLIIGFNRKQRDVYGRY